MLFSTFARNKMNAKKFTSRSWTGNLVFLAFAVLLSIPVSGYVYAFQEFPFVVQSGQVYRPVRTAHKVCSWSKAIQYSSVNKAKNQLAFEVSKQHYSKKVTVQFKCLKHTRFVVCQNNRAFFQYYHSSVDDNSDLVHLV